jgi:4-aminobutyrate aminotransferase
VTLAKGIGSGMPIGLIVGRRKLLQQMPAGSHGNTFGGNPVCCAAALKTLELIEGQYLENARQMGDHLMRGLIELQREFPCIGAVRGRGLMIGMELVADRNTRVPAPDLCNALVRSAWRQGLLLLSCGVSTIRFMPPLCVTAAMTDEALQILRTVLQELSGAGNG